MRIFRFDGGLGRRLLFGVVATLAAGALWAAPQEENSPSLFPLREIKPGMKGIGKTVFDGNKIEEFQVEILGVLENIAPRQNVILARLSGGPLERVGVLAGMSGSPVYIEGRLAGAVALAFQFAKEPIAGITPIEQMIGAFEEPATNDAAKKPLAWRFEEGEQKEPRLVSTGLPDLLPPARDSAPQVAFGAVGGPLMRVATPLVFSGFTPETIEYFEPQLRTLGMLPIQGGGGGSARDQTLGDPSRLQPGSMISVELVRGDLGLNADGTVTLIDGDRIYAFGHQFLSAGPTEIPFAESKVIAMIPGYASSLKVSTAGQLMGVIRGDRTSGILGVLGQKARMVPIELEVISNQQAPRSYYFEVVNDRFLLPFLMNMTVFSAIGATERMIGDSTIQVEQTISLDGLPEVKMENFISGTANAPATAARFASTPLAYLMQSGLGPLDVQRIRLRIFASDRRLAQELEQIWSEQQEIKPGGKLQLTALLRAQDGEETVQKTEIEIPASLTPGPLTIIVADGASLDRTEAGRSGRPFLPKDPGQLIRAINKSRRNNRLYVRLSRYEPGFVLQGENFPSPPPSVARTLATEPSLSTNITRTFLSTVAEDELPPLPSVVTGYKSITVTVKE
ncbi:MAG: hypothetical protein HY313_02895 [Acidobacteria bacterium]|nr:hypothetical protein [Acidobacteriota bacterium]